MKLEDAKRIKAPQRLCGIYFLLRGLEVIYVGQTVNLMVRLATHIVKGIKDFDGYAFLPFPQEDLSVHEARFIRKYDPIYNKCLPFGCGFFTLDFFKRKNKHLNKRDIRRQLQTGGCETFVFRDAVWFHAETANRLIEGMQ